MHIRSRRRIAYAALAGVLALGGTGLTIGVATAQRETDDPDLAMVKEAAKKGDSLTTSTSKEDAEPEPESEEISVADEPDDPAESDTSSAADSASDDTTTESDTDSEADTDTDTDTETDADADADAEQADGVETTDKTDTEDSTDDGEMAAGEEQAATDLTEEQARCPFTTIYKGSVKQMLIKREGVRTKAYNAGEKTKKGKNRNIITIGIGFNLSRGDARTIVNRVLSETTPPSEQDDIKSGKAFDDLKAGVTELTEEQVNALFEVSYEEAKDLVTRRGIESFDKLPRSVQAALIDVAFMRPGNINDIADEVNLGTQAALAKKQPLTSANYGPAAKRLETFGRIAAKRGQAGNKTRFDQDAAMLRNKC
ncbi:hypothetical protein HCN51_40465 [Nonomuraea sp. FMUSA5-5]|uniref:Uncharacterized protein n=1 Tax=Nonomuraea composti TaxID=2720023 RepID=A0ABX1BDD5_9ACTN|nr:hypothetical protein [Nonomuraea sp. FMUSA5-5]NJP95636.1 hypothetical protein [Nonomuraea sp. FMUSA5-5]